ncbi:hypothetical protein [Rhizobium phage RHph_X2_26]|nr:hypothetical protein [Rhizobium phage RHph_X2_26]
MTEPKPTRAQARALKALFASSTRQLGYNDFYRSLDVTLRSRYTIMNRMLDRDWIERSKLDSGEGGFEITPWGMKAIGEHEAAEKIIAEVTRPRL